MTKELIYVIFNTDMGWMGILASAKGLLCTTLPQRSIQEVRNLFGDHMNYAALSQYHFKDLIERFRNYFAGHKVSFQDELDLSQATTFQRKVWETTKFIPYGETRSYLWIAKQIGQPAAARAVGQALGRNSLPVIIPCHRVVTSDSKLGGYGGGLDMKKRLLCLEASTGTKSQIL